jgi:hypothetical protein
MSQQSVRQAARRSALEAQLARRRARAERARPLEGWRWMCLLQSVTA